MFFRKLRDNVQKNRIAQLEKENKRLEKRLEDEQERSGSYRITINEQDDKINKLELKLYNSEKFNKLINTVIIDEAKKLEANECKSDSF